MRRMCLRIEECKRYTELFCGAHFSEFTRCYCRNYVIVKIHNIDRTYILILNLMIFILLSSSVRLRLPYLIQFSFTYCLQTNFILESYNKRI